MFRVQNQGLRGIPCVFARDSTLNITVYHLAVFPQLQRNPLPTGTATTKEGAHVLPQQNYSKFEINYLVQSVGIGF